jgi:hypothetical protein
MPKESTSQKESVQKRGRFEKPAHETNCNLSSTGSYPFPASFNALKTFSGLRGSFLILTPVAL